MNLVKNIIKGIENVKGENINIIDFTKIENVDFKYFVICDCQSNIQVNAISNSVKKIVSKELYQLEKRFFLSHIPAFDLKKELLIAAVVIRRYL